MENILAVQIRRDSRRCLSHIQIYGDEQVHTKLIAFKYPRLLAISFSTAGGLEECDDHAIYDGLEFISNFIRNLHYGRKADKFWVGPELPPQKYSAKLANDQIEEEGTNEEIDAQLINEGKGQYIGNIKEKTKQAKETILNLYIDISNSRPEQYQQV
ncbi:MAG: hypothetical protein EZS28_022409 [Streblomastix strix]|uniref:Uncharacterized protein n=1 Tax=Streblomastix strix TaxID=222440 RepID=A0A5J4VHX6_9EUKA|nr:MAG: hypothetical protein EZS28_022409 [Streblomastix strix]